MKLDEIFWMKCKLDEIRSSYVDEKGWMKFDILDEMGNQWMKGCWMKCSYVGWNGWKEVGWNWMKWMKCVDETGWMKWSGWKEKDENCWMKTVGWKNEEDEIILWMKQTGWNEVNETRWMKLFTFWCRQLNCILVPGSDVMLKMFPVAKTRPWWRYSPCKDNSVLKPEVSICGNQTHSDRYDGRDKQSSRTLQT